MTASPDPWSMAAGSVASLAGGYMASEAAKDAAKIGRNSANRELGYMMDAAAKADRYSAPYREAGYTALDALMSMTGLGGGAPSTPGSYKGYSEDEFAEYGGADPAKQPWLESGMTPKEYYWDQRRSDPKAFKSAYSKKERRAMRSGNPDAIRQWFDPTYGLAYGGPAMSGQTYNINEIGPENYYSGGAMTRTSQPRTIRPSAQGYVRPNMQHNSGLARHQSAMGRAINRTPTTNADLRRVGGAMGRIGGLFQNGGAIGRYAGGQVGPRFDNGGPITSGGYTGQQGITFGEVSGVLPGEMDMPPAGNPDDWIVDGPVLVDQGQLGDANIDPTQIGGAPGVPQENSGGVDGGYNFMTEPGYEFRVGEGMRALERSAAAKGLLGSGGFGRKAIRYGQDYASQEYQNVYNRIANIAGLGQVSAGQGAQNALYGGQGMAGAAGNAGAYGAMGAMGSGNAWASAFNQAAQLPWGDMKWPWGKKETVPAGRNDQG